MDFLNERYTHLSNALSGVALIHRDERSTRYLKAFAAPWRNARFLGSLTEDQILQNLKELPFLAKWQSQGHHKLWIELLNGHVRGRGEFIVWTQYEDKAQMLMHCIAWVESIYVYRLQKAYPCLCIEHLRLQNPRDTQTYALWPGQNFPPSGLLNAALSFFRLLANQMGVPLITAVPQYFHTAYLFSKTLKYIDPEMQYLYQNICANLLPEKPPLEDIGKLSWAFENGEVLRNSLTYKWPTEMQYFAEDPELSKRLQSLENSGINFKALYQFSLASPS